MERSEHGGSPTSSSPTPRAEGKNGVAWDAVFRVYFGQARPIFGLDDLLDVLRQVWDETHPTVPAALT